MNKFISIGVSLILITSNALAEDDIIQQAKKYHISKHINRIHY